MDADVALMTRLYAALCAMESPDGQHRALRSQYSRRGVCETVQGDRHSSLCQEWRSLIVDVDRWLTAQEEPAVVQAEMLEGGGGVMECAAWSVVADGVRIMLIGLSLAVVLFVLWGGRR